MPFRKRSRFRTVSGFGSVFIPARKTIILRWFLAMRNISALLSRANKSRARRSNGRSRGARVRAAPPGNIFRISLGDWARRWSDLAHSRINFSHELIQKVCNFSADHALGVRSKAAHAPAPVVRHGLLDLGLCIHHKRPHANDRLIDRLAIQEQNRGVFQHLDRNRFLLALKDGQFRRAHDFARPQADSALEHEERRGPANWHMKFLAGAALQAQIPNIHRTKAARGAASALILARDDPHKPVARRQLNPWNIRIANALVAGLSFLILRGKIDPKLDDLELTATLAVRRTVKFLMD